MRVGEFRLIYLKLLLLRIYLFHIHPIICGNKKKEQTKPEGYDPIPYSEPHSSERDGGHNNPGDCC